MPRIAYESWKPSPEARSVLAQADAICREYRAQGYDLTLRQLYYQFVARGFIPNNQRSYKRLGEFVNRGRLAGLLDWGYITDRTRNLRGTSHWDTPGDVISSAAASYRLDKWEDGNVRVEVWVEKEALAGVVQRAAAEHDLDWFACRGYVSQSELWAAGQRHLDYVLGGQRVVVLHLGDHDPSGIDMTRDIEDRLDTFLTRDWLNRHADDFPDEVSRFDILQHARRRLGGEKPIEVRRLALNMDQVEELNPPPNPAKLTDSRVGGYIARFGEESWELDALDPTYIADLITEHVDELRPESYESRELQERRERADLRTVSDRWDEVVDFIENGDE